MVSLTHLSESTNGVPIELGDDVTTDALVHTAPSGKTDRLLIRFWNESGGAAVPSVRIGGATGVVILLPSVDDDGLSEEFEFTISNGQTLEAATDQSSDTYIIGNVARFP